MKRAWIPCALTTALAVADFVLTPSVTVAAGALMLIAIAVTGAVVASRRPDNPSGWLLSVIALSFAGSVAGDALYEAEGLVVGAWLAGWVWVPAMVSVATFPLVFPTGKLLSPRWRPVLWGLIAVGPFLAFGAAFSSGELEDYPGVRNPFGMKGVDAFGELGFFLLLVLVVASIAALVVRFRRSRGVERQQLKWVTAAAAVFPLTLLSPFDDDAGFMVLVLGVLIIALAVAVAILRYRLYDIDVVIRRTVTYAALTATLVGAYLLTILISQLVLPARSRLRRGAVDARRRGGVRTRARGGSRGQSTGASSAAATTLSRRWRRSGCAPATRSTSTRSPVSCASSSAPRCSPRTSRSGCGRRDDRAGVGDGHGPVRRRARLHELRRTLDGA